MKRGLTHILAITASAAMLTTGLVACSGGDKEAATTSEGKTIVTLAGWNLKSTEEFKALADSFNAQSNDIEVQLKEYSAKDYDTLLVADLSGGKGPDMFPIKNMTRYTYYENNGQLADVSDIMDKYKGSDYMPTDGLEINGKFYAVPFRNDKEVVYVNKDLFKKAGVELPSPNWTWDDYIRIAKEVTTGLEKNGSRAKGCYTHVWPIFESYAGGQTGKRLSEGDPSFLKPFYDIALTLQNDGSTVDYSTAQSQALTYQSQFGKQHAAMMPMGTWYIGTLKKQQANGDADKFEWASYPSPQIDKSTVDHPVTYAGVTPIGINGALKGKKLEAAKKVLEYAASPEGAIALTKVGIVPANMSPEVVEAFFSQPGVPNDEISRSSLTKQKGVRPFNYTEAASKATALMMETHTAILTGNEAVDPALAQLKEAMAKEGLGKK